MKTSVIVPVVRPESEPFFLPESQVPAVVESHNERQVAVRPLRTNKRFDLIGISQTAELLSAGVQDQTDMVNAFDIKRFYVELDDGRVLGAEALEPIHIDLSGQSPEPWRTVSAFRVELKIDGATTIAATGEKLLFGDLDVGDYIRLVTDVVVYLNPERGELEVMPKGHFSCGYSRNGTTDQIASEALALTSAKLVGFIPFATRGSSGG